jgi:hypothetical protein
MGKVDRKDATDKIIKTGGFIIAIVGAVTALITWVVSLQPKPVTDTLSATRIATYTDLSLLVGRMISNANTDSLKSLGVVFNEKFYNGEMLVVEDTAVSKAMKRFKLELEDKLNGVYYPLDPTKFENSGRDVIQTCQKHIKQAAAGSQ